METALMKAIDNRNDEVALALINLKEYVNKVNEKGITALMKASSHGNKEIAIELIKSGADVNIVDKDGETALMKASCYNRNKEIAIELIKSGADVNITDNVGQTALRKAILRENDNIAQAMIDAGADVNIANEKGKTALMVCTNEKIALALIKNGANVNVTDEEGETALMKAVIFSHADIAKTLMKSNGADINITDKKGETALIKAVCVGDTTDIIDDDLMTVYSTQDNLALALINEGADVNIADAKGTTALMKAVKNDNDRISLALIKSDANVNFTDQEDETALMKAIQRENLKIVHVLIRNNVDCNMVNNKGETALMKAIDNVIEVARINGGADINIVNNEAETSPTKAIDNRNYEIPLALINGGADVNIADEQGETGLMKAIDCKSDIALALINKGADVNHASKNGETSLTKAIDKRNYEIMFALINRGARDVKIAQASTKEDEFETELMEALRCGNDERALELIKRRIDLNKLKDQTALMQALCCGDDERALELIKSGTNLNNSDEEGKTALMKALYYLNNGIIEELIVSGADLNVGDRDGETALMKSIDTGNGNIALALIKGGADVNIADTEGETALMLAFCYENNEIAQKLMDHDADINIANKDDETAIMQIVECDDDRNALWLIGKGVDVNIADNEGETALTKAVYNGNEKLALAMITDGGADVNFANYKGETTLMYCTDEKIATILIENGANVNIADNEGETALMTAVRCGEELLLAVGSIDNENITDTEAENLKKNLSWGNNNVARTLIKSGADVNLMNKKGETALMHCGNDDLVHELIAAKANVNLTDCKGNSALIYAVKNECVVSALLREVKALVNVSNNNGRTPLFYAILERNNSARYILDHGGNLNLTDNFNVSILSFFIHDCMNKKTILSRIHEVLNLFKEQAVVQAIIDAVFCKFPIHVSSASENLLPLLQLAVDFVKEENAQLTSNIQSLIKTIEESKTTSCNITKSLSSLINLGANPNTADENGNTALHNIILLSLRNSFTNTPDICHQLKEFGLSCNKKNYSKQTPLLYLLSNALKLAKKQRPILGISEMMKVCMFLLKADPSTINDQLPNGKSVFHLVIRLFQKGLTLKNVEYRKLFLQETVHLLELISPPKIQKGITVNKFDNQMCSPLHYWASLSLPSPQRYASETTFKDLQHAILKHLLSCGAKVNARNQKGETPLHVCKTWTALKLLVEAGANTCDVDTAQRTPLLVAAQNRLFLKKRDCFYPDFTEDSSTFWRNVINMGFDLWACDKDGNSVINILIKSKAFVLAKSFVEVACDDGLNKSDEALVCVLNAICRDSSVRATWKAPILLQTILKSKRRPSDLSTFLLHCCINIIDHEGSSKAADKTIEEGTKEYDDNDDDSDEDSDEDSDDDDDDDDNDCGGGSDALSGTEIDGGISSERESATHLSVHWQVAKQLLLYGANGERCLDLTGIFPALKDLLTNPPSDEEVPMVIPWTSYSKTHKKHLSRVARRQNCKSVETYWYHNEHIGSGTFGHVFAGINENDGMEVAIKRIEKLRMVRPQDKREIRTFLSLSDCKQIVQYLACYEHGEFSYIVLELMEGNLDEYFKSAVYDEAKQSILSKDVVMGLEYLHAQGIIHRDLKPSNILYKTHPNLCLKIADFGLSRRLDANSSATVMGTNVGTRAWIAPEVVNSPDQEYATSSDIFSCGLILHYILTPQRHPFDPTDRTGKSMLKMCNERENNILNNSMDGWDISLAPEVSDLVKLRMLHTNAKERPPASELLGHPMFWSDKKKMDLLSAVGSQSEFECPRVVKRPLTAIEKDLEGNIKTIVRYLKWDHAGYTNMNKVIAEMKKPIVRGKRSIPSRKYDTGSVVELVRFIRNAIAHVSEASRPRLIRSLILSKYVFLKEFPNLVMEIYKAVIKHGWDATEEIKHVIRN